MTNIELVLNMLAEVTTTALSKQEKPKTFEQNKNIAKRGGGVANTAKQEYEKVLGLLEKKKKLLSIIEKVEDIEAFATYYVENSAIYFNDMFYIDDIDFSENSALIYTSFAGYCAEQDTKAISQYCKDKSITTSDTSFLIFIPLATFLLNLFFFLFLFSLISFLFSSVLPKVPDRCF